MLGRLFVRGSELEFFSTDAYCYYLFYQ